MKFIATVFAIGLLCWVGVSRAQSVADSVRINEIMYAPDSTGVEFVELFNASSIAVNLSGWKFFYRTKSVTLPNIAVPASGFVVLTRDTSKLASKPAWPNLATQISLPALSNSGAPIALRDNIGRLIDSLTYLPKWGGSLGRSLERREWNLPNDSLNWASCINPRRSTPGALNSITPPLIDIGINADTAFFRGDTLHLRVRISNHGSLPSLPSALDIAIEGNLVQTLAVAAMPGLSVTDTTLALLHVPQSKFSLLARIAEPGDAITENDSLSLTYPASLKNSVLVVNEIMYAPVAPEPEWIELLHPRLDSLDVSNCKIQDHGSEYSFPSHTIIVDSFLVVTGHDSLLRFARPARYGLSRVVNVANFPTLSNSGGALVLIDGRGEIVDSAIFAPALGGGAGSSLERIGWDRSGSDSSNWTQSVATSRATMGYANSKRKYDRDLSIRSLRDSSLGAGSSRLWITIQNQGRLSADSATVTIVSVVPASTLPLGSLKLDHSLASGDSITLQLDVQFARLGRDSVQVSVFSPHDENSANDTLRRSLIAPITRTGLLLNEIMYAPLSSSSQWIEFYNNSTLPIETSSCRISIRAGSSHLSTNLPSIEIPASGYAVLTADSAIYATFPELQNKDGIMSQQRSSLYLSANCTIALANSDSTIIDTLSSNSTWTGRSASGGISLERISTSTASLDSQNWQSSVSQQGATPLGENSVSNPASAATDIHLDANPNPFTPDGDGHDDVSNLSFSLGLDGEASASLRVLDLSGRAVRILLNGQTFYRQGQAVFDGKRDDGTRLPMGIYVIMLDTTDQNGTVRSTRTGIVIAKQH